MNFGYMPVSKDERLWATFCHLSGFLGCLLPVIGNIMGPLICWLIKREDSEFVDDQGKEALNFQITIVICLVISILLSFVVIGIPLLIATFLYWVIFMAIAAVQVNNNIRYRYPLVIRFF
ncbi:MAG: DUF4870 domain-containing protein [bacterium]|jgi:uncharacterized Tic20 family protein